MNFVTRSEFRKVLTALSNDIQQLRENVRNSAQRRQADRQPSKPIPTITKVDSVSSIETRTPDAEQKKQRSYYFWSLFVQWSTFGAVVLYATIAAFQWLAMKDANINAQRALSISESANVTVGRSDGTIAEVIMPEKLTDNAALVIFFQNSGRLPARFNWGARGHVIAMLPKNPKAIKESEYGTDWAPFVTDHVFQPMYRAKDRKQKGAYTWSGAITIAGNSAYQGAIWEIPKERLLQLMNWDREFSIQGTFDYCDGFGKHVCQNFDIMYSKHPYNFSLINEDQCSVWEMQVLNPRPDLEYLSPCEVSEKREEFRGSCIGCPNP